MEDASARILIPAKINLLLDIGGKRADGYHELYTIMQSIRLVDEIEVHINKAEPENAGIFLMVESAEDAEEAVKKQLIQIPTNHKNTAYRAAEYFLGDEVHKLACRITVKKAIPAQAGMGGGSADAAGVLRALAQLYPKRYNQDELLRMATAIGADVPFCLMGGTALCQGIGEKITGLPSLRGLQLLLVKPPLSISTPEAFAAFDQAHQGADETSARSRATDILADVSLEPRLRLREATPYLYNSFEATLEVLYPELKEIRECFVGCKADLARLSGSGSTVFAVFSEKKLAEEAWISIQNVFGKRDGYFLTYSELL